MASGGKRKNPLDGKPGWQPIGKWPKCRQCHCTMKPIGLYVEGDRLIPTYYPETATRVGWGYLGNSIFCTLKCGFHYGVSVVMENARHLEYLQDGGAR